MKTRFYNILVPKFLRNFDDYLLCNYPVVWRTKAIFILFYGLVGAVLLFAAGFFYPVDAQHLTVKPDKEIRMGYDTYHLWSVLLVGIGLFYWAYYQYQLGFPFTKIKDSLLTLLLYACGCWFLFSIVTPAFRLGTIYKTANHWINKDDMKQFEESKIYPYGFVLLEEDTIYKGFPADTFFQRRERMFNLIWEIKDTLLLHLYTNDILFWRSWYVTHGISGKEDLNNYQSAQSTQSYLSPGSWSYLPSLSYLSYFSSQLELLSRSSQLDLLDLPYRSYQSYQLDLSSRSLSTVPSLSYLSYLSSYEQYKQKCSSYIQVFDKYGVKKSKDSTKVEFEYSNDHLTVYRTSLPYSVEKAVYSVKNARLYLAEKIYTRHWALVLKYSLLLAALFYLIPFLSIRHVFGLLVTCILASVIISFKLPEHVSNVEIGQNISNAVYLLLPTVSCLILLWLSFIKKQTQALVFAEQGLFIGILCILFGALFIIYRINLETSLFYQPFKTFQPPYDLAFYGVQVLGVLGAVLTTYVRTLPKQ